MAFIDEITIYAEAGRGGDGVVRWRQEKFIPKGGPAGGDGGRGGNFGVVGVRDVAILAKYKAKKHFEAPRGGDGGKKSLHGKNGEDFFLEVPVGTIVKNLDTDEVWHIDHEGQKEILLKGGYGGYGNEHFKSSTNVAPQEANKGGEPEKGNFKIELELFADMGLIGLPNAGKSSLLNMLTNAKAKVANYAFTTLDPNLGVLYGYVLADIPGLIEGASAGKGLGFKFLRHVKRTKMLAHLVSFENEDMMKTYKEVRKELEKYDKENKLGGEGLSNKDEIIVLTKTDIVADKKLIDKEVKKFEKLGKKVLVLSLYDDASIKNLNDAFAQVLAAASASQAAV